MEGSEAPDKEPRSLSSTTAFLYCLRKVTSPLCLSSSFINTKANMHTWENILSIIPLISLAHLDCKYFKEKKKTLKILFLSIMSVVP